MQFKIYFYSCVNQSPHSLGISLFACDNNHLCTIKANMIIFFKKLYWFTVHPCLGNSQGCTLVNTAREIVSVVERIQLVDLLNGQSLWLFRW